VTDIDKYVLSSVKTIYCYQYSKAHVYAEDHNIPFVLVDRKSFADIGSILIEPAQKGIGVGAERKLTARFFPISPKMEAQWKSSAPDVISVSEGGTITAHKEGTATITASVGEINASITMTAYTAITEFTLPQCVTVLAGSSITIPVTELQPVNGSEPITWTSANTEVAKVDAKGLVTTRSPGETLIIAATDSGLARSTRLVVSRPPPRCGLASMS